MCITYKLFKTQLHFEKHLLNSYCKDRINLTKLRCSNSKLPIYSTIYLHDTQTCTLCNMDALGDEYHYVLICPFFKQIREQYLKAYYYIRPSHLKLEPVWVSIYIYIYVYFKIIIITIIFQMADYRVYHIRYTMCILYVTFFFHLMYKLIWISNSLR